MRKVVRKFFYSSSDDEFKVVYFWSTLFLSMTAILIVIQTVMAIDSYICGYIINNSLNGLIGILSGLTVLLIANYNYKKKDKE